MSADESMLSVRRAEPDDTAVLADLWEDAEGFGSLTQPALAMETYVLCLTATAGGKPVGFAAFDDRPSRELRDWPTWMPDTYTPENSVWLCTVVSDAAWTFEVVDQLFRIMFATLPRVKHLLICDPGKLPPAVGAPFTRAVMADMDVRVRCAVRDTYFPPLIIRPARVEDHDDLSPIFTEQCEGIADAEGGDYFLAELIESQDDVQKAVVAELKDRAVGLMALSADVDVRLLQQAFDLEAYDHLVRNDGDEEEEEDPSAVDLLAFLRDDALPVLRAVFRKVLLDVAEESKGGDGEGSGSGSGSGSGEDGDGESKGDSSDEAKLDVNAILDALARVSAVDGDALLDKLGLSDDSAMSWRTMLSSLQAYQRHNRGGPPAIVLVGPSKVGKTVLAESIADYTGAVHLTVSAIERLAIAAAAASGEGDEHVTGAASLARALRARLGEDDCVKRGYILDGYPATIEQALALTAEGVTPQTVLSMNVSLDTLQARGFGRKEWSEETQVEAITAQADALSAVLTHYDELVLDVDADLDEAAVWESARDVLRGEQLEERAAEERAGAEAAARAAAEAAAEIELNCFAITLFCLDSQAEPLVEQFLHHVFALFPERDYCLLTLPHTAVETPLLRYFTAVPQLPGSLFSHALYVFHRHALLPLSVVEVQPSQQDMLADFIAELDEEERLAAQLQAALKEQAEQDAPSGVDALVAEVLGDSGKTAEEGKHAGDGAGDSAGDSAAAGKREWRAFATFCSGQLVGISVLHALDGLLPRLRRVFALEEFMQPAALRASSHGELASFVLNPIFTKRARFVLCEALRQAGMDVIHHMQYADERAPLVLPEFVQVRPSRLIKRAPVGAAAEAPHGGHGMAEPPSVLDEGVADVSHALFFSNRKLLNEPKLIVNARVVVVGASDTGLSCLEALLMKPYLHFSSLTLVSPGGLPDLASSTKDDWLPSSTVMTARKLAKLSLGSRVAQVSGKVVAIDRINKTIVLDDDSELAYDLLLLTTGLQDATATAMGDPEAVYACRGLHFVRDDSSVAALEEEIDSGMHISQRRVLVYGSGIQAYQAAAALLERGAKPGNLLLLRPDAHHEAADFGSDDVDDIASRWMLESGIEVRSGSRLIAAVRAGGSEDGDVVGALVETMETGERQRLDVELIVASDTPDVDFDLFAAVNESGLVYNGRLIVDTAFRTVDHAIMAAGTLTQFSKRYARAQQPHERFSSLELGAKLAASVLAQLDPLAAEAAEGSLDERVPSFLLPKTTITRLPGGLWFLRSALPKLAEPVSALSTRVDRAVFRYTQLLLDASGRLGSITYMGTSRVAADNLEALIGLHESFLNSLVHFHRAGKIDDLIAFFQQDWATALYHDRFQDFVLQLRLRLGEEEEVRTLLDRLRSRVERGSTVADVSRRKKDVIGLGGAALSRELRQLMQGQLLAFIRDNREALGMYFLEEKEE